MCHYYLEIFLKIFPTDPADFQENNRDREELRLGQPFRYLNSMSHGQNISSTSGQPGFLTFQYIRTAGFTLTELTKGGVEIWHHQKGLSLQRQRGGGQGRLPHCT